MYEFDPDRLQKLADLRAASIVPYPTGFTPNTTTAAVAALAEGKEDLGALGGDFVLAGRLLFKNEMGKAGFARILDGSGRLQIYVKRDHVGEDAFAVWKKLDLGDIVGFRGGLMRTRTGELSLEARELVLLSKCIRSLPDKFHGMSDPEVRQRQRYVDLFVNPEVRETFVRRSKVLRRTREFFEARGYLEVETPMMQVIPGGATARPFVTHHNALDMDLYLRIAPELYLKRLVVGGLERVFEINRNFRNEGIDSTHNPEFTMLEFYQAYATWKDLVAMTEELFHALAVEVTGSETVTYQGQSLSFARPFRQARYDELVAGALGLPREAVYDLDRLRAAIGPAAPATLGRCWEHVFDEKVEKTLTDPTFVTHFPVEISPLARRSDTEPGVADRFELFVAGRELANGFNELNDPVDQRDRFEEQARQRKKGDDEAMYFDADYIDALSYGLPPTAGEGIGIDRLVMLLTDAASIREVILFPTLRSRG